MVKSIIDEYITLNDEYKKIYGEETVVFMQVGSFYELYYTIDNNNGNNYGPNLKLLAQYMNISISKKNVGSENTVSYMAGFPDYIVDKYIEIMLNYNYTIVIIDQFDDPMGKNNKKIRKVTNIFTPSNYINNIKEYDSPYIMCIYYYELKNFIHKKIFKSFSLTCIDLSVGKTILYENIDKEENIMKENLQNIFIKYKPKELIILSKSDDTINELNNLLNLNNIKIHKFIDNELDNNEIFKIKYQEHIIKKLYPETNNTMLNPFEYLNLEKNKDCCNSFIFLIDFIYKMNSEILYKLDKPIFEVNNNFLKLPYNFITKLNILNENTLENVTNICLIDILNNCKTNIGKRYFKYNILNPLIDTNKINKRYNYIEYFNQKNNDDYLHNDIRKLIEPIPDIERYVRKMFLKNIKINEFNEIIKSFEIIVKTIDYIENTKLNNYKNLWKELEYNKLKDYLIIHNEYVNKFIKIDKLDNYNLDNINSHLFNINKDDELFKLQKEYDDNKLYLKNLEKELNTIYNIGNDNKKDVIFKLEYNDKIGYFYLITKLRFKFFKDNFKNNYLKYLINNKCHIQEYYNNLNKLSNQNISDNENFVNIFLDNLEAKTISSVNKQYRIVFKNFNKLNEKLNYLKDKIKNLSLSKFYDFMIKFYNQYKDIYKKSIQYIEWIDFNSNNSYNAIKFNYKKPIINNKHKRPFLDIKEVRHPIIERINNDFEYIVNDIELGTPLQNGILLYGINSSGKSSFMKSVGLVIVMAQTGMYVPCSNMEYYPYKKIYSRIPGGDNIFKGDSTFVGEIKELRNILKDCDKNTLVIGDELCSGTETTSAISIVYSGIVKLINKESCFMFATHLHELSEIDEIQEMSKKNKLNIYHLTVTNRWDDKINKNIMIFDRKLKKGSGSKIYGLEICEYLGLDEEFLKTAFNMRKKILNLNNNFVNQKRSNYNKNLYMDLCQICKKNNSTETHHIDEQKYANKDGYINNIHKNSLYNLIQLCEECHNNIHNGNINIQKKILTSNGIKNIIN